MLLVASPPRRRWIESPRQALHYGRTRTGLVLFLFVLAVALLGPLLSPHAAGDFVGAPLEGPSGHAFLGTDYIGRDVLARVLYGGMTVIWMSFASSALAMTLGVGVGLVAGYTRNALIDEVLMRSMDVVLSIPALVFVLLCVSTLNKSLLLITVSVALAFMPAVARVARGATVGVAQQEYVEAAQAIGLARRKILVSEILPNIATPLLVEFGLRLRWAIGLIAALSFLGYGIQQPTADWGLMINENRLALTVQPWAVLAPIVCIALFTVGTNLIADGISRTVAGINRVS